MGERRAAVEGVEVIGDAFSGQRVLVTGHTGFKGSWLTVWLNAAGAKVAGYALDPPTKPNMFDAAGLSACVEDHRGDIRDAAAVRRVMRAFDPEIVFHLAAQAIVRQSYRDPVETYATNVLGTATLLDAARDAPSLRAVVVVTSDKCYENRDLARGYVESDPLGGYDPYSSSKACAELVTEAFRRSFFDGGARVGIATARAGNVVGGGDWAADRLVPDLARAAADRRPAEIRYPDAIRPWQHVLDPTAGYLMLAAQLAEEPAKFSGSWNFGPHPDAFQRVADVVDRLGTLWHGKLRSQSSAAAHPHEASRLLLDSAKAGDKLHWRPKLAFDDALRLTAEWYDAFPADAPTLRGLTAAQIDYYDRLAA